MKNAAGDLFTVINLPELSVELTPNMVAAHAAGTNVVAPTPAAAVSDVSGAAAVAAIAEGGLITATVVEEQAITMTRSLGDFYAHHHGVSAEPE